MRNHSGIRAFVFCSFAAIGGGSLATTPTYAIEGRPSIDGFTASTYSSSRGLVSNTVIRDYGWFWYVQNDPGYQAASVTKQNLGNGRVRYVVSVPNQPAGTYYSAIVRQNNSGFTRATAWVYASSPFGTLNLGTVSF